MQYRKDKKGRDLSLLGYGCMRFTRKGNAIDLDKAEREVTAAIEGGVNYLDTAYIYPGNEAAVGEILRRNGRRDQVYLATKLPHYLIKSVEGAEKIFREELRRLGTDHIDYYLMHMLTDAATWEKLKGLGMEDWIAGKLESGEIRNIGFSYHGSAPVFKKLVDAYDWDFCQIQYNYMDETSQAGVEGLRHAHAKGLPAVIMEPLRGGRLVDLLPQSAKALFQPGGLTPAALAFKWLYDQPEVTCVLSGMNSREMVEDNVKTASEVSVGELGPDEEGMLQKVVQAINAKMKVGCTGCGYCMPCPKNVDIPGTFAAYNRRYSEGKMAALMEYFMCTAMRRTSSAASNCIQCGKCERHCPQHIEIRKELKNARRQLEGPVYRIGRKIVSVFRLY